MQTLKIATRKSPLAVWQAEHVASELQRLHPSLTVELVKMVTKGDQLLDSPLSKIGGKGLFVKELETALYNGDADIAVHSMKDVPMALPEGLKLAVIMERESPFDAFCSNHYSNLSELPAGAKVGTSSLRRSIQIQARFPQLVIEGLRGNINTRLQKLDDGQYDAIILAASGLKRMSFDDRIKTELSAEDSLPAVGQGALGIECRHDDNDTKALIAPLSHAESTTRLLTERAMNTRLNGGCQVPIGGYAELHGEEIHLRGFVGDPDGNTVLYAQARGTDPQAIGIEVAEALLAQGADVILGKMGLL